MTNKMTSGDECYEKRREKRKRMIEEHYLYSLVPTISPEESNVLGLDSIW